MTRSDDSRICIRCGGAREVLGQTCLSCQDTGEELKIQEGIRGCSLCRELNLKRCPAQGHFKSQFMKQTITKETRVYAQGGFE